MEKVFIYTLSHPLSNEIRYVGKTNDPKGRWYKHCQKISDKRRRGAYLNNWLNKLFSQGLKPALEILDEVSIEEWEFWECYWIAQLKMWGFNLVNLTNGGEGIYGYRWSEEQRIKQSNERKGLTSKLKGIKHTGKRYLTSVNTLNKNRKIKLGRDNHQSIPVLNIDPINNKIVGIYGSAREAERQTGVKQSTISLNIKKKLISRKGDLWVYEKEYLSNPMIIGEYRNPKKPSVKGIKAGSSKCIAQIDINNNIITVFETIQDTVKYLNISSYYIKKYIKNNKLILNKFYLKFISKEEYINNLTDEK